MPYRLWIKKKMEGACQTAIILHYVTSSPFVFCSSDSCELVGKDRSIVKISTPENNAVEEKEREREREWERVNWSVMSWLTGESDRPHWECTIKVFIFVCDWLFRASHDFPRTFGFMLDCAIHFQYVPQQISARGNFAEIVDRNWAA